MEYMNTTWIVSLNVNSLEYEIIWMLWKNWTQQWGWIYLFQQYTITWKETMKNREIQWNVMNFYNTPPFETHCLKPMKPKHKPRKKPPLSFPNY